MKIMDRYQAGINLGGWISQYKEYDIKHFDTFIQRKDIEQVAIWGFDHIRLPFDYPIFEDDISPYQYKKDGFDYIDNCLSWCKEFGLNLILDLHRAPGYSFNSLERNTLFQDEKQQDRLIKLWEAIASHYINERENLLFELLNEIVEPDSTRWNLLSKRLVATIREIDKERVIIIGGNNFNAVSELKNLDILDDDRIVYNFHFYEPMLFTHQKAHWFELTKLFNREQNYPGKCTGVKEFCEKYPQFKCVKEIENVTMDKALLESYLQPARDFLDKTGKPLYCGEYGVIECAPVQDRLNWHEDFISILKELKIGRACWSYKLMDFSIVDSNSQVVSKDLVKVISAR